MMSPAEESETSSFFLPDDLAMEEQQQLCYVHCNFCDTILSVGVPCSSLFTTVPVQCGQCANLLSVDPLLPPAPDQLLHSGQALLSPTSPASPYNSILQDEMWSFQAPSTLLTDQARANVSSSSCAVNTPSMSMMPPPRKAAQRESQQRKNSKKRQTVPTAYNLFIRDEIQRIKANNPDMTHREAFAAAGKNWAHSLHIHFGGMMPDLQGQRKTGIQIQDGGPGGECMFFEDGLSAQWPPQELQPQQYLAWDGVTPL